MRSLLLALSLLQLANGLLMLVVPQFWYSAAPGVVDTGPFNTHFIRDVGLGFMSAGCALGLAALYLELARPLVAVASIFLVGHALLHLVEMLLHGIDAGPAMRDLALIVVPATLPLAALLRRAAHA